MKQYWDKLCKFRNKNNEQSNYEEFSDLDETPGYTVECSAPVRRFCMSPTPIKPSPETSGKQKNHQEGASTSETKSDHFLRYASSPLSCHRSKLSRNIFPSFPRPYNSFEDKELSILGQTNQNRSLENRSINNFLSEFYSRNGFRSSTPDYRFRGQNSSKVEKFLDKPENSFFNQASPIRQKRSGQKRNVAYAFDYSKVQTYSGNQATEGPPALTTGLMNKPFYSDSENDLQLQLCETLYNNKFPNDSRNWVTIFGFPEGDSELALKVFSSNAVVQEVRAPRYHPYNYIHVRYENRMQVAKIIRKQWVKIAPGLMVGAVKCMEPVD